MLRTIAFCLAMSVGVWAALSSRVGGLLFYLWFALFRPQEWVWIDVESFRLSLIAGALFVVPTLMAGIAPDLTHPLGIGSLMFLFTGLLAQVNAVSPETGWFWINFLVRQIVVSLLLIAIVNTPRRYTLAITVISCSLAFHASKFGVGYLLRGGARFDAGIGGSFGASNEFSLAVDRILFLLIAAAQNIGVPWMRLGMLVAVPFSVLGILSTFSRGGFLALICGSLVFLVLQRRRTVSLLIVGLVVVAYQFVPVPESYIQRMDTITTYEEVGDQSALGRLHFWRVAMAMAADQPLGVGLRNFEANYDRYDDSQGAFKTSRSVHSIYFQALAENGYAGAAIFLFLIAYSFWVSIRIRWRSKRLQEDERRFFVSTSNALIASLTAFAIGGAFNAEALNELNWFTFALVAALDRLFAKALASKMPLAPVSAGSQPVPGWPNRVAARTGASLASQTLRMGPRR
jgi:probable O-glycosylation ligase (exosortase A-associated)